MSTSIDQYLTLVRDLYVDVRRWLEATDIVVQELEVIVDENRGSYSAPQLNFSMNDSSRIAELKPIGTSILAGEGRVDLVGPLGIQVIRYLLGKGPSFIMGLGTAEEFLQYFYNGVQGDGWYWIEREIAGLAHQVTKELFIDLLTDVSDHVVQ